MEICYKDPLVSPSYLNLFALLQLFLSLSDLLTFSNYLHIIPKADAYSKSC